MCFSRTDEVAGDAEPLGAVVGVRRLRRVQDQIREGIAKNFDSSIPAIQLSTSLIFASVSAPGSARGGAGEDHHPDAPRSAAPPERAAASAIDGTSRKSCSTPPGHGTIGHANESPLNLARAEASAYACARSWKRVRISPRDAGDGASPSGAAADSSALAGGGHAAHAVGRVDEGRRERHHHLMPKLALARKLVEVQVAHNVGAALDDEGAHLLVPARHGRALEGEAEHRRVRLQQPVDRRLEREELLHFLVVEGELLALGAGPRSRRRPTAR